MVKKSFLIAGGGYADIPLIRAAKSLGFYVITSGNRADDLGHQYSDECRLEDFSDKQAMLRVAEALGVDAICACCNDFSALTAAYVAEKMGLPGHDSHETAKLIHHKDRYRKFAWHNGIPTPKAAGFTEIEEALSELKRFRPPVIVKPVDLTGGKGVSTVRHVEEMKGALETAFRCSRAKRVVVEQFLIGSRHGLSTFLRDGKVVFHFSDNEQYYLNPHLVSAASVPGTVSDKVVERLCANIEKIAAILELKTGIVHAQYILHGDDPYIIEICRRSPGDLYTRFVQHATGVDYAAYIVKAAAGLDCSDLEHVEPKGYFTRHCIMASRNGYVAGISTDPSIKDNIKDQLMWWKEGQKVNDYLAQKFGIVFLQFNSEDEMLKKTTGMQELIRVDVQ